MKDLTHGSLGFGRMGYRRGPLLLIVDHHARQTCLGARASHSVPAHVGVVMDLGGAANRVTKKALVGVDGQPQ